MNKEIILNELAALERLAETLKKDQSTEIVGHTIENSTATIRKAL